MHVILLQCMWWTPSIVKSSYCLLFESRVMAEELAILEISTCPRWSWGPIISWAPCFLGLTDVITNRKKQSIFLIIKNKQNNWSEGALCSAFYPIELFVYQTGLGPSFAKTGNEFKSQGENSTFEKRVNQISFLT